MVCHEFVCNILREGGAFKKFGDLEFNCNEFSLYDVEKLKIFE